MTAPRRAAAAALGAAAALAAAGLPAADSGRILFGQSAAFSGPARELGEGMRLGLEAAFQEANAGGGVHGRRLELHTLDDAYEPEAAVLNTRRLIEEDRVFALIGAVGTPTARAAVPVAAAAGVPYLAPFTGAGFLRDPAQAQVINLRASYAQEAETIVERLTRDLEVRRIGLVHQDDSFGRAGYQSVRRALQRRQLQLAGLGVYARNTTAVKTALLDLRHGDPEAVIVIGAYKPAAALIRLARHIGFRPVFATISFTGSRALVRELGSDGAGVYVTQVVPPPTDERLPVADAYRRALAARRPDARPDFVSFEGYLAGRLAAAALERCGPEPARACLTGGLRRAGDLDLGGFALRYSADDNQGSDAVFLTVIGPDGRYRLIDRFGGALRP